MADPISRAETLARSTTFPWLIYACLALWRFTAHLAGASFPNVAGLLMSATLLWGVFTVTQESRNVFRIERWIIHLKRFFYFVLLVLALIGALLWQGVPLSSFRSASDIASVLLGIGCLFWSLTIDRGREASA